MERSAASLNDECRMMNDELNRRPTVRGWLSVFIVHHSSFIVQADG
jgi:hypothetical protein